MKLNKAFSNKSKKNSGIFNGTYKYYMKYRPGIPKEVVDKILKAFNVKPKDRMLDVGCGTGQVAISMDGKFKEIYCMDSDPGMIKEAKKVLKKPKSKVTWHNYSSTELKKLEDSLGIFKVVTICRAFHWMDQKQVLSDLDDLITEDGGIAIFGDGSIWTGKEEWQIAAKSVVQKYLGEERRAGKKKFKQSVEPWEKIISRSTFNNIKQHKVRIVRNWDIESVIGWLFSSSFASPKFFGNKIQAFKKDIERELLSINPKGIYKEKAVFSIILASRGKR